MEVVARAVYGHRRVVIPMTRRVHVGPTHLVCCERCEVAQMSLLLQHRQKFHVRIGPVLLGIDDSVVE